MNLKFKYMLKRTIINMSNSFNAVGLSCLIWYFIDPNIETIYTKIHLITAFVFAIPYFIVNYK